RDHPDGAHAHAPVRRHRHPEPRRAAGAHPAGPHRRRLRLCGRRRRDRRAHRLRRPHHPAHGPHDPRPAHRQRACLYSAARIDHAACIRYRRPARAPGGAARRCRDRRRGRAILPVPALPIERPLLTREDIMAQLTADNISLAYADRVIVDGLDLDIAEGTVTTIIGPNGCGKSTLLRSLARLMSPKKGAVLLDGQAIQELPSRAGAKQLGLLAQGAIVPDGVTVAERATRGRYPHPSFFQPPAKRDAEAVEKALELAGMTDLRDRPVQQLSGGQRQRAWIAMALAQETPLLLLDEP